MSAESRVDVIVVGAGPAGIAAATRAAESGRSVMMLDEGAQVGGNIWRHRTGDDIPADARAWITRLARSGATVLNGVSVMDVRAITASEFLVAGEQAGVAVRVRASALVLATGARERFVPFPGWTLPGVYGIGGAQALLKAGLSFAGKRVVIAGSGPLLLPVAASLTKGGARVVLVAEQARFGSVVRFAAALWRRPEALVQAASYRAGFIGTPYTTGTWVLAAHGDAHVESVTLTNGRSTREIACDVLCSAHGLVPNTELARLLGCATSRGAVTVDDRQQTSLPNVYAVGESTGIGGVDLALVEGEMAGLAAADSRVDVELLKYRRAPLQRMAERMERAFAPRDELRACVTADTIVCRCEDVVMGSMRADWTPRQAKLYTRAGMGPCQGRMCGASLEFLFGWPADSVRVPSEPALLSTILASSADEAAGSLNHGA